jgi:hypothetical protein
MRSETDEVEMAVADIAETTEPVSPPAPSPPKPSPPKPSPPGSVRSFLRRHRFDLLASLAYLAGGFWVYLRLWVAPDRRLAGDGQDHQLFIWMLAQAARSVTHLENPLFSARLNVPYGVNMMANTSVLGLGIPMTPVTLLFGAQVSFAVVCVLSLAGTAAAWYYVFSRHLVSSRVAALLAGALCGFAPGMIAHSPGHLHIIAQFVLPFIVLYTLKLAEPGRTVRHGVILGLLIAYQVFVSEELLLLAATGTAGLIAVYAVLRWREARSKLVPFVRGLAVAGGLSAVLLAYPLGFQAFGPQNSRGLPFVASTFVTNALAYVTYPGQSVAGDRVAAVHLASNYGEENAFFGWPLLIVLAAAVAWMWRSQLVRVLAVTGLAFMLVSLGNHVAIASHHTRIPAPFLLLSKLPVLDMALPTRFSLIVVPILGALLALAADRVAAVAPGGPLPTRLLATGTAAAILVPIAPIPLHGIDPPPIPAFVTNGTWRSYVPEGHTLVPVPLPRYDAMDGMRWAAATDNAIALPRGFAIGPDGSPARQGTFDAPPRPTSELLRTVAATGNIPAISERDRVDAVRDLRFWRAAVVVLGPHRYQVALLSTLDALIGPGRLIGGAWVWDVRTMLA